MTEQRTLVYNINHNSDNIYIQNNNTVKIQTHKGFKRMLFIKTRQNQNISGVISFVKLQNDTWTTSK